MSLSSTFMQIEQYFTAIGGEFFTPAPTITERLRTIKAFVFDWDGVFNDSSKTTAGSPYSEVSSMGTNLLRFGYWYLHRQLPTVAIITGENNQPAIQLAQRERFQAVYSKFTNKQIALDHLCETFHVQPHEIAFVYDDVLDLPIVRKVALRMMVRRKASPLFTAYIQQHQLADYLTACEGQNHAVREVCELFLGLQDVYEVVVAKRGSFDAEYQQYLQERNSKETMFFIAENQQVVAHKP
jgi:3-deoxy-D-manno-octulosonate 8-phosphate phosphatase (KDO 8-P phosphatase)